VIAFRSIDDSIPGGRMSFHDRYGRLAALACLTMALGAGAEETDLSRGIGRRAADFTLTDVATGQPVRLYGFAGKKAAVLVFTGTNCPVGNKYMPRLAELNRQFAPRGVVFLAINSNDSETTEAIAAHAREYGLEFPVLKDPGQRVADALEAERTCEALVLDGEAVIRYRGAIDDQYGTGGSSRPAPRKSYLVEALQAVLEGREVETTATSVDGCPIERAPKVATGRAPLRRVRSPSAEQAALRDEIEGPLPEVGPVTYAGEVAAILQNRCQSCHRPGQVGPFALLTYEDAKRWAASIEEVVADRRMPPWHADPRHGRFANDRHLSPRERATLLAWVEQGAPLGDAAKGPPARSFPEGWTIGTPDQVFELPKDYVVKAEGVLNYQRFRVPTNFEKDVWVQAAEARPGDRSVVHHIIVYVDDHRGDRLRRQRPMHLCGYAPGDMPSVYPSGVAKRIPAGSDLIFEMHYTPNGKIRVDRSSVGLIFAKEPVTRQAITRGIANQRLRIPALDPNFEVRSAFTFKEDSILLSFMPHMHLRGKDFLYTAVFPDGRRETLLSVPAYDFGWQSYYILQEPRKLPAGTRIECVAHYDNSPDNPANPDPNREVGWGEQTWDEMMIGYVDYVVDRPVSPDPTD
jgi:peroxiredoxin/mono/diheme cytochrome c family protein